MGSFSPLKDWRILIFVGIILLVLLWWFLGGSVEEPDFSEKNISRDYCNITPESSETPSKEDSSKEDSSKEDSFWSKTKTPDLQKKHRSFGIELDQNTENSHFDIELSRDITRRSRIRPFFNGQQGPRTPLSTDPTMSMSVSVSLEDALATKA